MIWVGLVKHWRLVAIAVAVLAVIGAGFGLVQYGKAVERAEWETKILQKSVDALRQRRDTNADVQSFDDADLCRALGGMPDKASGKCL